MTGTAGPPGPGERHPAGVPGPGVRGLRYDSDADQTVAALYRAPYGSPPRIAALLMGGSLAAEDMVQDAFASVYCAWRHLRDEKSARDHLRRAVSAGRASWPRRRPDGRGRPSWPRCASCPRASVRRSFSGTTRTGPISRSPA